MQHVCHGGPLERITYPRIATEREYLAVTLLELIDISPEMTAMTATLNLQHSNSLFGARPIDVGEADSEGSHLVVSPYTSLPHLLDLSKYPMSSQLFAKALAVFHPIRENYATAEYTNSFNFARVMETLRSLSRDEGYSWRKTEFYVVSFRSQLSLDADPERLFQLDALSHQEAIASGGLLKYWYGVKDRDRRNLATCFWESRQHARDGSRGPRHAKARAAAAVWYESVVFKTYVLTIEDDVENWSIADFAEER